VIVPESAVARNVAASSEHDSPERFSKVK